MRVKLRTLRNAGGVQPSCTWRSIINAGRLVSFNSSSSCATPTFTMPTPKASKSSSGETSRMRSTIPDHPNGLDKRAVAAQVCLPSCVSVSDLALVVTRDNGTHVLVSLEDTASRAEFSCMPSLLVFLSLQVFYFLSSIRVCSVLLFLSASCVHVECQITKLSCCLRTH